MVKNLPALKNMSVEEAKEYLDDHDVFKSSFSFWFDRNRLPQKYTQWPLLYEDLIGDHGIHVLTTNAEFRKNKPELGERIVPISFEGIGYCYWNNTEIQGYPNELSATVGIRYVFDDINSQKERSTIRSKTKELGEYAFSFMGFSEPELEELNRISLNFHTASYKKNPRIEFHAGGGLCLQERSIDSIISELFQNIDKDRGTLNLNLQNPSRRFVLDSSKP